MERETIYLDNDEEITSVVDKLKNAETSCLDLVIPKEALLLQSVVNLKLLKKQAESLGKEITIVTQDKVGRKLAEQIGIPVVEKVGEVPKEVKMKEADEKPEPTGADIEFKKGKGSIKNEESDGIEFKGEEGGVVAATAEVVSTATIEKPKVEEPAVSAPEPTAKGKNPKAKKLKRMLLAGGFITLVLMALAYIYVPLANVTLKVAAEKKKIDFNFVADKDAATVDNGTQTIPLRSVTTEVEKTEKYPATGKKDIGEKATGAVTISNKSGLSQTLVAGTRIQNSAGLVFKLNSNVTVDKATVGGSGDIVPGTISGVAVTADQPGEKYNLGSTTFSFPGLAGKPQYSLVTATNPSAFTGGSTKQITFVTQADINKAKEEIKKSVENELKSKAAQEVREGERLLEEAVKFNEVSAEPSKNVNDEADEFELKAKTSIVALVIKEEDLKKLAENVLSGDIGETKEIVESGSLIAQTEFVSADFEKGEMKARLSGEAYIATKVDEATIKAGISGDSEGKAIEYLKGLEGVEEAELRFFPKFYKRVPRVKAHIYLKTTISKVQEGQGDQAN